MYLYKERVSITWELAGPWRNKTVKAWIRVEGVGTERKVSVSWASEESYEKRFYAQVLGTIRLSKLFLSPTLSIIPDL